MITSLQNEKIKHIIGLKEAKNRKKYQEFLIEGFHLIEEAKKYHFLKYVVVNENVKYEGEEECIEVSSNVFTKLQDTVTSQNIIGVCKFLPTLSLEELKNYHRVVILDNVQDPGNGGTIIRNSLAFNNDLVVFTNNSVDFYNPKFIRSTQGYLFKMKMVKLDLLDTLNYFKNNNYQILTTYLSDEAINLNSLKEVNDYCLIMGNEGSGVSKLSLDFATHKIIIPLAKSVESLNVGVANGIVLYYLNEIYKK